MFNFELCFVAIYELGQTDRTISEQNDFSEGAQTLEFANEGYNFDPDRFFGSKVSKNRVYEWLECTLHVSLCVV